MVKEETSELNWELCPSERFDLEQKPKWVLINLAPETKNQAKLGNLTMYTEKRIDFEEKKIQRERKANQIVMEKKKNLKKKKVGKCK